VFVRTQRNLSAYPGNAYHTPSGHRPPIWSAYIPMTTDYYLYDHGLPFRASCHLLRISLTVSPLP